MLIRDRKVLLILAMRYRRRGSLISRRRSSEGISAARNQKGPSPTPERTTYAPLTRPVVDVIPASKTKERRSTLGWPTPVHLESSPSVHRGPLFYIYLFFVLRHSHLPIARSISRISWAGLFRLVPRASRESHRTMQKNVKWIFNNYSNFSNTIIINNCCSKKLFAIITRRNNEWRLFGEMIDHCFSTEQFII